MTRLATISVYRAAMADAQLLYELDRELTGGNRPEWRDCGRLVRRLYVERACAVIDPSILDRIPGELKGSSQSWM